MYETEWCLIIKLARIFDEKTVIYHFDASTSVFIHGIEFDMDDIDIAFISSDEAVVRETLAQFRQGETQIISETVRYFIATVDGRAVHCMFFGKQGHITDEREFNRNADCISVDGQKVMAQCVQFYLKYSDKNAKLKQCIKQWLEERGLEPEPYYPIEV